MDFSSFKKEIKEKKESGDEKIWARSLCQNQM